MGQNKEELLWGLILLFGWIKYKEVITKLSDIDYWYSQTDKDRYGFANRIHEMSGVKGFEP